MISHKKLLVKLQNIFRERYEDIMCMAWLKAIKKESYLISVKYFRKTKLMNQKY